MAKEDINSVNGCDEVCMMQTLKLRNFVEDLNGAK